MASADDYFFPSAFGVRVGPQLGCSEEQIREAKGKLYDVLSRPERQLEGKQYPVGSTRWQTSPTPGTFTACERWPRPVTYHPTSSPHVPAWMERVEGRESYKASA
jgi:hypothetical protein